MPLRGEVATPGPCGKGHTTSGGEYSVVGKLGDKALEEYYASAIFSLRPSLRSPAMGLCQFLPFLFPWHRPPQPTSAANSPRRDHHPARRHPQPHRQPPPSSNPAPWTGSPCFRLGKSPASHPRKRCKTRTAIGSRQDAGMLRRRLAGLLLCVSMGIERRRNDGGGGWGEARRLGW